MPNNETDAARAWMKYYEQYIPPKLLKTLVRQAREIAGQRKSWCLGKIHLDCALSRWAHHQLIDYRDKYAPCVDIYQYTDSQISKGIVIVHSSHRGIMGVVLSGDRFSRREMDVLWQDGTVSTTKVIKIIFGNWRRVYWPPGIFIGGGLRRMYRHLDRRWAGGH